VSKGRNTHQSLIKGLRKARKQYDEGKFSAAGSALRRLLSDMPSDFDTDSREQALLLGLFSFARSGEYEKGWQLKESQPALRSESLEYNYVCCYLAYQQSDYSSTFTWGERYLSEHANATPENMQYDVYSKKHEILNTLGCASKDQAQDARALDYLDSAIAVSPDYPLPYLNAALVCKRKGDSQRAGRYVETGLKKCGPVDELLMFQKGMLADAKISLCMIVKDEEEMLPQALDSVKGLVDEIIIVDTGSTDRTVDIAKEHGAKVFFHPWEDDFSKSRNYSIGYATGDWVFILDADEELSKDSAALLRKVANTCTEEAVSFSVYNIDTDNDQVSFLPSVRLFRNGRGYTYRGIVHNQITLPKDCPVMRAPIRIDHYGYTPSLAEKRGKFERTTGLLRKQILENPNDAFAHFNMAQIMRGGSQGVALSADILKHASRVTEILSPKDDDHIHILLMAHHQMACAHFNLEAYQDAASCCQKALAIKPDFIDALMTLGHSESQRKNYEGARESFLAFLRAQEAYEASEETRGFILLNLENEHQAYYGLGLIEEASGNAPVALEWYRKVLLNQDDYLETHRRIGQLCYADGRWEEAEAAFRIDLEYRPHGFWAHYCQGDLAVRRESWTEAYDHYLEAHQSNPNHAALPFNLALTAFESGQSDKAHDHLNQMSSEIRNENTSIKLAAKIAYARKDYEVAQSNYEAYLKDSAGDAEGWCDFGNVYFRTEKYEPALECYARALDIAPDLMIARRNRAMVWIQQKQFEQAAPELEQYVADPNVESSSILLLADLWSGLQHTEKALPFYERYLSIVPDDLDALFRLSQCYHLQGRLESARQGYHYLLEKQPDYEPARTALSLLSPEANRQTAP